MPFIEYPGSGGVKRSGCCSVSPAIHEGSTADTVPLREAAYSEAWIANSTFGDIRVMLRTPGRFDFDRVQGTWEYRGWFQQMWSYETAKGDRFRVPVFVFADARPLVGKTPAMVGQMTTVLLVIGAVMAVLLFVLVRRDRARANATEKHVLERRKRLRQKDA